jgi:hypothetical protein
MDFGLYQNAMLSFHKLNERQAMSSTHWMLLSFIQVASRFLTLWFVLSTEPWLWLCRGFQLTILSCVIFEVSPRWKCLCGPFGCYTVCTCRYITFQINILSPSSRLSGVTTKKTNIDTYSDFPPILLHCWIDELPVIVIIFNTWHTEI